MFSSKISVFGTEWLFRFCMRRQIDLVLGTGSYAKTSLWCKRSSSCWRVGGRRWKLSYIGTSTGVLGLLIQV